MFLTTNHEAACHKCIWIQIPWQQGFIVIMVAAKGSSLKMKMLLDGKRLIAPRHTTPPLTIIMCLNYSRKLPVCSVSQ